MKPYRKIQTVFLRDPNTGHKTLLNGQFACTEFEYLCNTHWRWFEKIDGTNIRVRWDPALSSSNLTFKGRLAKSSIPEHLREALQNIFPSELFQKHFPESSCCLYGEGFGLNIQKPGARYLADRCGFILFDVRVGPWWLQHDNVINVAAGFNLPVVPEIGHGTLPEAIEFARQGFKSKVSEDPTLDAEGLILRPSVELQTRSGHRIISKIKYRDFPS